MKTHILHTRVQIRDLDTRVTAISGLDLLNQDHFNHCVRGGRSVLFNNAVTVAKII
jgi:hypothetical protein